MRRILAATTLQMRGQKGSTHAADLSPCAVLCKILRVVEELL
jgi:hypothetical protein